MCMQQIASQNFKTLIRLVVYRSWITPVRDKKAGIEAAFHHRRPRKPWSKTLRNSAGLDMDLY